MKNDQNRFIDVIVKMMNEAIDNNIDNTEISIHISLSQIKNKRIRGKDRKHGKIIKFNKIALYFFITIVYTSRY